MTNPTVRVFLAAALATAASACAAPDAPCAPTLETAWIRAAPPGAATLAGYAVLRNECAVPVTIVGAESVDFGSVEIHQTIDDRGVTRMRASGSLVVAPKAALDLAPGGSHLMLMRPARALPEGATARIGLVLADGRRVIADFAVRRDAPAP